MTEKMRSEFELEARSGSMDIERFESGYSDCNTDYGWIFWQAATKAERERCARVCDSANNYDNPMTANDCADAIRQGGDA